MTGRVVECLIDEMNRPRLSVDARVRIPPTEAEIEQLFAGWRQELMSCRKFAPAARNYMVALTCQMIEANIGSSCEGQPAGSEVHKCSTAPRRPCDPLTPALTASRDALTTIQPARAET